MSLLKVVGTNSNLAISQVPVCRIPECPAPQPAYNPVRYLTNIPHTHTRQLSNNTHNWHRLVAQPLEPACISLHRQIQHTRSLQIYLTSCTVNWYPQLAQLLDKSPPTNSKPTRPAHPRTLRLGKLQTSSHQPSVLTLTGPRQQTLDSTPGAPYYTLHDADLQPLPHQLSDNSSALPDTPPRRALALHSQQFTQSAQPPPRPRPTQSTWLPGRQGIRLRWGRLHPLRPQPRVRFGSPAHPRGQQPSGAGALEERKLTCLSRGRKKFGSHPLPPQLRAG